MTTKNVVPIDKEDEEKLKSGSILGDDFLFFDFSKKNSSIINNAVLPVVNPSLWKASLTTLDFMPLISADAFNGIIITDWYQTKTGQERLKITITIQGSQLRADGLKVMVHKQKKIGGEWINSTANPSVALKLEEIIFREARRINKKGETNSPQ